MRQDLCDDRREKVTEAAGDIAKVWKLVKRAKNWDALICSFTPPIMPSISAPYIHNSEGIAKVLGNSFFSAPPEPDLEDLVGYAYLDPTIAIKEIKAALNKDPPQKAPNEDGIPLEVLLKAFLFNPCLQILPITLPAIFNHCNAQTWKRRLYHS